MKRLLSLYGIVIGLWPACVLAQGIIPGQLDVQVAVNHVPIVHIAAPNRAGVSHNTFQQFNVPKSGLILHNTPQSVTTQQAGLIAGHPHLTQHATLIINEVTQPHPSHLLGLIEVAGPAAPIVIANPWGMTCNGCGFINTPHATLTTGQVQLGVDGDIARYRVQGGAIHITGQGLDASNSDYVSILTRSLTLNAALQAKHIQLVLDSNDIDAGTGKALYTNATPYEWPRYALDVSTIGGMYADKITLIGTEQGLGVNFAGTVRAKDQINITLQGAVTVGNVKPAAFSIVPASSPVRNNPFAAPLLTSPVAFASAQFKSHTLNIHAPQVHHYPSSHITANQLQVDNVMLINEGRIEVNGSAVVHTDTFANKGKFDTQQLSIAAKYINNSGDLFAGARAEVVTDKMDLSGKIQGAGSVNITVAQGLINAGFLTAQDLTLTTPQLSNQGYIQAEQQLTIASDTFVNGLGKHTLSKGAIYFGGNDFHNQRDGVVWAATDLTLEGSAPHTKARQIFNEEGLIQANRDITLRAELIKNHGFIVQDKDIIQDRQHDHSGPGLFSPCNEDFDPNHCQSVPVKFRQVYYNKATRKYDAKSAIQYYPHEKWFYYTRWVGPDRLAYPKQFHEFVKRHPALNNMTRMRNRLIQPGMGWRNLYKHSHDSHEAEEGGAWFTADIYTQRLAPHIHLHPARMMAGQHIVMDANTIENRYANIAAREDIDFQGNSLLNEGRALQKHIVYNLRAWKDGDITPIRHEHREDILHINSIIAAGHVIKGNLASHINNTAIGLAELAGATATPPTLVGLIAARFGPQSEIGQQSGIEDTPSSPEPKSAPKSAQVMTQLPTAALTTLGFMTVDTKLDGTVLQAPTLSTQPIAHKDFPFTSLIVGQRVLLHSAETIDNTGTIAGLQGVALQAKDIQQSRGHLISQDNVVLQAEKDIALLGGAVKADNIYLAAGNTLHIATAKAAMHYLEGSQDFAHHATALSADTDITTTSQQDTTITGAQLNAGNSILIQAGQDIVIDALSLKQHLEKMTAIASVSGSRWSEQGSTQQQASHLQAEDLTLTAQQDVISQGATLVANKQIDIQAGRHIALDTKTDTTHSAFAESTEKENIFSKKKDQVAGYNNEYSETGTLLQADTVNMAAGKNINGIGLTVLAQGEVKFSAGQDITLTSATSTHEAKNQQTSQGIGQSGHLIGKFKTSTKSSLAQVTQQPSVIGSYEGSITANAQGHILLEGTDLIAGQHIVLDSSAISLLPVQESQHSSYSHSEKKVGFMFALSGSLTQATRALESAAKARREGDSEKANLYALQAVAIAANALHSGKNPQAEQVNTDGVVQDSGLTQIQQGSGGNHLIKGTLSVGRQHSHSAAQSDILQNRVSTVAAQGDVTMTATGEATKAQETTKAQERTNGSIDFQGAQVSAQRIILKAARDILLHSAIDTTRQHTDNKQSGVSAGIGLGYGGKPQGFTLELATYLGQGQEDQGTLTHRHAKIEGQDIHIAAGSDTTLKGAQIIAEKVTIRSLNLHIESPQDSETFDSTQKQHGGTASVCVPPYCTGTSTASIGYGRGFIQSRYQSVNTQSGIQAGQAGFDINVKGHTEIIGGALNSTTTNNRLVTGTLNSRDIDNSAHYHAGQNGLSLTLSANIEQGKAIFNPAKDAANSLKNTAVSNMLPDQVNEIHSTTKSVIAPGLIDITDEAGQLQKTGHTAEATLASLNRDTTDTHQPLDQIFDLNDIKRQQEINQIISNIAQQAAPIIYEQIGDVLQEQDAATKAAVHGVIGGVLSTALGGKAAAGAVGGTLTSLAVDTLGQKLDELNLSPDNREAILLAVSGVLGKVSGEIISHKGQVGNVAAFTAMQATEYNYLSHWQEKAKAIEEAQCTSVWCRISTAAKWALVNTEQNSAFITGMATSIPDMVLETAEGIVHIATHPTETYQAIKQLLSSEDIIGTVSQAIRQNYIERFNKIDVEYERAGPAGAYYAGLEAGKVVADAAGILAGGVGIAKGTVKLTEKLGKFVTKPSGPIPAAGSSRISIKSDTKTLPLSSVTKMQAEEIRFSQNSVSFKKNRGDIPYTYEEIVKSMQQNGWQGDAIDVIRMPDGKITSITPVRSFVGIEKRS